MADQTSEPTFAEILELFKETATRFKETDAKFKETDAKFKETDAKFKETDARLDRRFRDTDANLRRLENLFIGQWGRLMEALVQPGVLNLFRARGIDVHYVYPRAKSQQNGNTMEIDLLLENATDILIVEVKTTLRVGDIDEFLEDLRQFLHFFPRYANHHIYAAVAGLQIEENADRYAYKQGLFVLGIGNEGLVQIKNDEKFKPRDFHLT